MKLKFLASFAACALTLTSVSARDGHEGGGHSQSDIQGSETFEAHIVFTATADAPPCASGRAQIEAENEDGTVTAALAAHFSGLPAGDYLLSAVKASDGSSELLAQLSLGAPADNPGGDDQEGDSQGDWQWGSSGHGEGQGNWGAQWQWCLEGEGGDTNCEGTFGARVELQLPADLDAADIAQLVLSDTNGTALLVGDATGGSSNSTLQLTATIRLAHAVTAPHARGKALLQAAVHNGRHSSRLNVLMSGVAPNAMFHVQINGRSAGQAKSGRGGTLSFQQPRLNAVNLRTLNVVDAHGRAIAHGHF